MSDQPAAGEPEVDIRVERLEPSDAAALPEAIRSTYGDSYDHAWAYDAEAVAERLAAGTLVSYVGRAASPEGGGGPVVGHAGLLRDDIRDAVGESGLAVVDPEWRSHHLFPTLKGALAEWCRAQGMLGMYSEVTAAHPYSEKANLRLGAREAGFLLGYIPADVTYAAIDTAHDRRRLSVAVFWLSTNPVPTRTAHPPPWHAPQVQRLYEHLGLPRRIAPAGDVELRGTTVLSTEELEDHDDAVVTLVRVGEDVVDAVEREQQRLAGAGRKAIYLDLALSDPATAALPVDLHDDLGFFFGAVVPERRDGDVLRMQSLHAADVDPSDMTTASDFGAELLDYVFEQKRSAAHGGVVP